MRKVTTSPKVVLEEISRRAPLAHAAHARQTLAFVSEQAAEVRLIAAAVELTRPALPSIMSKYTVLAGPSKGTEHVAAEIVDGLWLLPDGQLAEWPERKMVLTITIAEAIQAWDPIAVLQGLSRLLDAQIKGRGASAEVAERAATKLNAIVTLLKES